MSIQIMEQLAKSWRGTGGEWEVTLDECALLMGRQQLGHICKGILESSHEEYMEGFQHCLRQFTYDWALLDTQSQYWNNPETMQVFLSFFETGG